jgi:polyisoprenoid-binding protein YceI
MNIGELVASAALVGVVAGSALGAPTTPPAPEGVAAKPAVSITHELTAVRTATYKFDHDHARVVWNVSHHGYSTFSGLFTGVTGHLSFDAVEPTHSTLEAIVDMNSVGTQLPDFDARLKGADFFNTAKFPTATFRSTNIERTSANSLLVRGDLTFLGVTKPVVLEATFNQAGDGMGPPGYRVGFDGRMNFKRSDFGMAPSTIGDTVTLQIEAEFQ